MENVAKLLEQARTLERHGEHAAALKRYSELEAAEGPHQDDPAFWTRLGRLRQRAEQPVEAAEGYQKAVDLLLRSGQRNNALALSRRIARVAPSRTDALLRFAELAAEEGYQLSAREGALEYAAQAAAGGDLDDAIRALSTFRDRFPRDAAGRRALADHLRSAHREAEAVEELRALWALLRNEDREAEAEAVREEITALRPDADPELQPVEEIAAEDEELGADELPTLGAGLDQPAGSPAREADLLPTALDDALPDPFAEVAPLEGLEPTAQRDEPDAQAAEDELPEEPTDLPLIDPLAADAEPEAAGAGELPPMAEAGSGAAEADAEPPAAVEEERPPAAPTPATPTPAAAAPTPSEEYVDLGALVLDDDKEQKREGTRFRVERDDPSGDEEHEFAEILDLFRQQVSQHIDPDDTASHYDLGLAFKEMGLLDDAIAQFQTALRAGANPLATLELLGECFAEKNEHSLAARILSRATQLEAAETELVGVYYLLGRCEEALGHVREARGCYERVIAVDIGFRDASDRLRSLRNGGDGAV